MSSANLDFVRSIFADWERGDFSSSEWADPEIDFELVGGASEGTSRGLAGMSTAFRGWLSAWEAFRVEAEEYRELDDERVLVLLRVSGRGKISGLQVGRIGTEGANLFHIRDRKVTRLVLHWDLSARSPTSACLRRAIRPDSATRNPRLREAGPLSEP